MTYVPKKDKKFITILFFIHTLAANNKQGIVAVKQQSLCVGLLLNTVIQKSYWPIFKRIAWKLSHIKYFKSYFMHLLLIFN